MSRQPNINISNNSNKNLAYEFFALRGRMMSEAFMPSYTSKFLYYMIENPAKMVFRPLVPDSQNILTHNETIAYMYTALQKLGFTVKIERYLKYKQLRTDLLALDTINHYSIAFEIKGKEILDIKELERAIGQLYLMKKIIPEIIVVLPKPLATLIPDEIAPAIIALSPGTKNEEQQLEIFKHNPITDLYPFEEITIRTNEVDFLRFTAANQPLWQRLKPLIIKTYKETKSERKTALLLGISRDVVRRAVADIPKDHIKYPEETKKTAIQLYKKYWSPIKVAQILNISRATVYRWILNEIMAGNQVVNFIMEHSKLFTDIEKVREAIKLRNEGKSPMEISSELGVHIDTVYRWFRKLNKSPKLLEIIIKTGEVEGDENNAN
ncbi:MAG: helix-turn-helix domain-containing protein [Candidatus Asgardarchaeia archaeon]